MGEIFVKDINPMVQKASEIYKLHKKEINYKCYDIIYYCGCIHSELVMFKEYAFITLQTQHYGVKYMKILPNKITNKQSQNGEFNFIIKRSGLMKIPFLKRKDDQSDILYVYYNDKLYQQVRKDGSTYPEFFKISENLYDQLEKLKVYYINTNDEKDVCILKEDYTFENCTDFTNQDLEI